MNQRRFLRAVCATAAVGAGLAAGAYATYVATTWRRFGRWTRTASEDQDSLLDRLMPTYDVVERHAVRVAAPVDLTFSAACAIDLRQSTMIGAIFKAREVILGGTTDSSERARALVPWAKSLGWGVLANVPNREIGMGAVTRPWDAHVVFRALPAEQFAAFNEPNYVKIVWTLRADAANAGGAIARTETRAVATDPSARRQFHRYWAFFSPGIILIRREALRLVKADAERHVREGRRTSTDRLELASTGELDTSRHQRSPHGIPHRGTARTRGPVGTRVEAELSRARSPVALSNRSRTRALRA